MGYNVVIADDMLLNRKLIRSVLEKNIEDINFFDAIDGCETLEYVEQKDIDLIILDLVMPNKNGFDVLKELKLRQEFSNIPVIVNSAVDGIDIIKEALELGADEYFTKPLTLEQLEVVLPVKVQNALKGYEQHKLLKQMNERLKEELKFANLLQHTLIVEDKELENVHMIGRYISSSEIGGDFYDCIEIDDEIWFIIADVSGHGVAAAMISSMLKVMFSSNVNLYDSPAKVLESMNRTFCPMISGRYHLTAFVGLIKKGQLTYSNAGHPYPIHISSIDKEVHMLEQNGFILGAFEDIHFYDAYSKIDRGDIIFCYTDGLLELQPQSKGRHNFSCEDINEFVSENRDHVIEDIESFTERIIRAFGDTDLRLIRDDIAIMNIKIKNPG
ncbi:MAG: fused response regulator/phosphatase [Clostridiales bacterium]|nr:fused response regulator/phosphatase [Clostridiales bacterium]